MTNNGTKVSRRHGGRSGMLGEEPGTTGAVMRVMGIMAMLAGMLMLMYNAIYIFLGSAMLSGALQWGSWGLALCILTIIGGAALCYAGWSALKNG